jgi:hypothetical protein
MFQKSAKRTNTPVAVTDAYVSARKKRDGAKQGQDRTGEVLHSQTGNESPRCGGYAAGRQLP